ncbi:DotH/IcmK family type IV secretion protein [Serratia quinivorans]|uniref:DotH/IcmK family type IV secretion protein n=1 Tax=Serratia quinivorans TaxID=137545 RepID=UPI0034C5EC51
MKIKTLTLIIAAMFAAQVVAADQPNGTGAAGAAQQKAPGAAVIDDVATWSSSSSAMGAPLQPAQQQPAQQQPAQQQNVPTAALPAAPMAQPAMPAPPVTTVNPASLEALPAPVMKKLQPITPGQVRTATKALGQMRAASHYNAVTPVPRVSSQTVSLSAGSSIPQVRVYPNITSVVTFSDATGHPWKLGAPPVNSSDCNNGGALCVSFVKGSAVFTIQPTDAFVNGNVTVLLQGLATPVIINVKGQDPSDQASTLDVDYRLDLRIPKRGPDTPVYTATPETKISLYDKQLQQFLDGIPPEDAQTVKLRNAPGRTKAWQIGDELYVRSALQLQDEFEKTLSAIDGTHVYVLPATPVLTFSENGKARDVEVELN